ncbi:hypothetical protein [Ostreiculturibacter nitratireducens]|uniref:hypothetical protein n=1 Tax=Ostreiculturibacter nitratireducens TaxID=3075226 RepID=UPI0031B59C9C
MRRHFDAMMKSEVSVVGLWVLAAIAPWILSLALDLVILLFGTVTGAGSRWFWRLFFTPWGFGAYVLLLFVPGAALAIWILRNAETPLKDLWVGIFLFLGCGSYLFLLLLLGFSYGGL